jgi:hypothetical protein
MSGFGSDEVECDDASGVSEVGHAGEAGEEAPAAAGRNPPRDWWFGVGVSSGPGM